MRKILPFLLCVIGLSGCFTSNVVVTVRPDGSGTVDQTVSIRPSSVAEFQRLASPEPAGNRPDAAPLSREVRRDFDQAVKALRLGSNLRLRSSRSIDTANTVGWALSYDFDDVSALNLDVLPQIPGAHGFVPAAKDTIATTRIKTTLEPMANGLERFTFRLPNFAIDPSSEPPASWATGSPSEMSSLKQLMEGSRITVTVTSTAPIVRTNSPFRQENRVTLLDADLAQALFSTQIGMLAATPSTFGELLTALADLPGVTLAHDHEIAIEVQNPSTVPAAGSAPAVPSQTAADTEIYLSSLLFADGRLTVGPPINISNSPGYDNQPSFTPDGKEILFASSRGAVAPVRDGTTAAAPPATDIYRYGVDSRLIHRVTNTPEAEFSPMTMADGNISVVRVEADATQRLWRVANSNNGRGRSSVILPDVRPVGYYAWMDDRTIAVFVLGQNGHPSTLQLADIEAGKAQIVASDVGRSIQRMPSGAISFVHREPATTDTAPHLVIKRLLRTSASSSTQIDALTAPPAGATEPFVAWMPDGSALVALDSTLYRWQTGDSTWTAVANLGAFGLHGVTRLAVSPKGDRIAIVASAK